MSIEYPYTISNNRIGPLFDQLRVAAKPPKVNRQFLENLGFTSSNDRALPRILKQLNFIHEDGTPSQYYDRLRDPSESPYVLGEQIKDLYSELFAINTEMQNAPEGTIKGAFARVTGKEEAAVNRYYNTFKALCALARFDSSSKTVKIDQPQIESETPTNDNPVISQRLPLESSTGPQFHYNIQIHLPATTDISVYNSIFKSLKENLIM